MGQNRPGGGASADARQIWQVALERIAQRVSASAYTTWFHGTSALELTQDTLVVGVGNTFACEHLRQRFLEVHAPPSARRWVARLRSRLCYAIIARAAPASFPNTHDAASRRRPHGVLPARAPHGPPARAPRCACPSQSPDGSEPAAAQAPLPLAQPEPASALHPTPLLMPDAAGVSHELNPRYVFETFVVGLTNQLAYAAAQQVAANPGESYNPLLIYGGVGLGKTHLLHAIGHSARLRGLSVAYVTAERFTNEIIGAIRWRTTDLFRARYRAVDMLLVDDVQFIAGKESTEEEFFHTFNTLHEANKQIVLTSDCVPQAMSHLHDRLRSRFAWGLIADIQPPDYAHRLDILHAKTSALQLAIPEEALAALAALHCESVRALEGALTRVAAYAQMLGQPIEGEMVRLALAPIAGEPISGRSGPARRWRWRRWRVTSR